MSSQANAALEAFDDLPDSAFVALPVVCVLFGCAPATVWRRVSAGELVAPHRFGKRTSRWNVGQLRAALAQGGA